MSCDDLYDRLTELAEGSLQGDISAEVEAHLAECRDCEELRRDLTDLARLCRQVAVTAAMPEDVRRRIETLLAEDAAKGVVQLVERVVVVRKRARQPALELDVRVAQRLAGRVGDTRALRREHEEVRAPVVRMAPAPDEAPVDEPLDVVAQRRHRHARELGDRRRRHRRVVADVGQEREQIAGNSDRLELPGWRREARRELSGWAAELLRSL